MRVGANRVIGIALLFSLALHAVLLALVPQYRELAALIPPEPVPLIARVERAAPPPPPKAEPAAARAAPPASGPMAPETRRIEPAQETPPAPQPAPEQDKPAPIPPVFEPRPVPEPAPAPPRAGVPLTRVDPRLLIPEVTTRPAPEARALERYRADINRAAADFKRYPRSAIDNNWAGEVGVILSVDAGGRIADLRVGASSGYPLLDRLALEMFREAHAVVELPGALRGRSFELELRAIYEITN